MKRAVLSAMVIACLAFSAGTAMAASGDIVKGKIALHGVSALGKNPCDEQAPTDLWCNDEGVPSPTFNVQGNPDEPWYVYAVVVDVPSASGVKGAAFSVTYSNFVFTGDFNSCGDQLFADPGFPEEGTGGVVTSASCILTIDGDPEDDVSWVLGYAYMYAYGDDVAQVIARLADNRLVLVDCDVAESDIPEVHGGSFAWGTAVGLTPCQPVTPVENTTWGALKRLGE